VQWSAAVVAAARVDRKAEVDHQPEGCRVSGLGGAVEGCVVVVREVVQPHPAVVQLLLC
jgi:hypothetical protein